MSVYRVCGWYDWIERQSRLNVADSEQKIEEYLRKKDRMQTKIISGSEKIKNYNRNYLQHKYITGHRLFIPS